MNEKGTGMLIDSKDADILLVDTEGQIVFDDIGNNGLYYIYGNCETEVIDARTRSLCVHYSDQISVRVERAAARVTRVYRRIDLHQRHCLIVDTDLTVKRADDTRRHASAERSERIADDDDVLSDNDFRGVAENGGSESRCVDLYNGDIGLFVATDNGRVVSGPVGESNGHVRRFINDMVVRDDISVRADNDAASRTLRDILSEEVRGRDILRRYLDDGIFNRRDNVGDRSAARSLRSIHF